MSAAILVLQLQGENFFEVEKFEISSHFQAVHCVRKNAISPKVFSRFSKTFHQLQDVENRYLGRKFHGRSYFSVAMVRWKFFLVEKFEIPTFKLYTVSEKMPYHQRYSPDFQKLSFCWKMWKIGIWAKNSWAQLFYFCHCKVKTFFWWENSKFPTSKLYTVSEKTLHHEGIQPILKKLSFCWTMWKIGILGQKYHEHSYFSFAMAKWKFFSGCKIWNFPLSNFTMSQRKRYIPKGIQADIQKLSFCWKTWKIDICGRECHERSYFSFRHGQVKTFFWWKNVEISPLPNFILSQKKRYITKGIQSILKNFPSAERCGE